MHLVTHKERITYRGEKKETMCECVDYDPHTVSCPGGQRLFPKMHNLKKHIVTHRGENHIILQEQMI